MPSLLALCKASIGLELVSCLHYTNHISIINVKSRCLTSLIHFALHVCWKATFLSKCCRPGVVSHLSSLIGGSDLTELMAGMTVMATSKTEIRRKLGSGETKLCHRVGVPDGERCDGLGNDNQLVAASSLSMAFPRTLTTGGLETAPMSGRAASRCGSRGSQARHHPKTSETAILGILCSRNLQTKTQQLMHARALES